MAGASSHKIPNPMECECEEGGRKDDDVVLVFLLRFALPFAAFFGVGAIVSVSYRRKSQDYIQRNTILYITVE